VTEPVPEALKLTITYSRSGYFGWQRGEVQHGGYTASLEGFGEAGQETTVDGALEDLASKLGDWVGDLDADADWAPLARAARSGDRPLLRAVQQLLIDGSLRTTLGEAAARIEPVLDQAEEPPREQPSADLDP